MPHNPIVDRIFLSLIYALFDLSIYHLLSVFLKKLFSGLAFSDPPPLTR